MRRNTTLQTILMMACLLLVANTTIADEDPEPQMYITVGEDASSAEINLAENIDDYIREELNINPEYDFFESCDDENEIDWTVNTIVVAVRNAGSINLYVHDSAPTFNVLTALDIKSYLDSINVDSGAVGLKSNYKSCVETVYEEEEDEIVYENYGDDMETVLAEEEDDGNDEQGKILGDDDAPVEIEIFADYQGPFDKRWYDNKLPLIKEEFIDQELVFIEFKHFPLSFHQDARERSYALECAADQDRFFEYLDVLFEDIETDHTRSAFYDIAETLNFDVEEFTECMEDDDVAEDVDEDFEEGQERGVSGTPTFFINGERLVGDQAYEVFREAIDRALGDDSICPPLPIPAVEKGCEVKKVIDSRGCIIKYEVECEELLHEEEIYECNEWYDSYGCKVRECYDDNGRVVGGSKSCPIDDEVCETSIDKDKCTVTTCTDEDGRTTTERECPVGEVACSSGCWLDGRCLQYGIRTKNGEAVYCDISGKFIEQKDEGAACQNDYECLSNSCSNGACIDLAKDIQESKGILEKILGWLSRIFG